MILYILITIATLSSYNNYAEYLSTQLIQPYLSWFIHLLTIYQAQQSHITKLILQLYKEVNIDVNNINIYYDLIKSYALTNKKRIESFQLSQKNHNSSRSTIK